MSTLSVLSLLSPVANSPLLLLILVQHKRVVGVLGCMAERLKSQLLESDKLVDLVVGPDAYRSLPALLAEVDGGQTAMNVQLSLEETYADITPVRMASNNLSAFLYVCSLFAGCQRDHPF